MRRLGFVVNPIAGLGGRVGLKGTDGVVDQALAAGAEPGAGLRARSFGEAFLHLIRHDSTLSTRWLTCAGPMGLDSLRDAGIPEAATEIVHRPGSPTTADDTRRAVRECVAGEADLLLFCGGDGTARDVAEAAGDRIPILGIPAGVKMHSGVFAVSPRAAAQLVVAYLRGSLKIGAGEMLDLDEDAYRKGEWRIRLLGTAKTLVEPNLVQSGKALVTEVSDEGVRAELAEHLRELFAEDPDTLFLVGPGSTLHQIAEAIGVEKTLLGIDAFVGGKVIAKDVNESRILGLLDRHAKAQFIVSPIGAQGFILGRGNLQVSPAVVRRIGPRNVLVVATPGKLASTPVLRVDTGDPELDAEFKGRSYWFVVVGYGTSRVHPIEA